VVASLDKLRHIPTGNATAAEVKADLNQAHAALTAFAHETRGQYQTEIGDLQGGLGTIKLAAAGNVSAAIAEIPGIGDPEGRFLAAVSKHCPSVSPTLSA
jgi:hypothetical protein